MHVRQSGITEQALREAYTHGQPEMKLRRGRCDPTAPEVVLVSSRATAHRAASSFVSLSASQSRSTHCQTGRARRRHLRVREDIPATRDTHHTKQPPTDRREGGKEGRKEGDRELRAQGVGDARSDPLRNQLKLACRIGLCVVQLVQNRLRPSASASAQLLLHLHSVSSAELSSLLTLIPVRPTRQWPPHARETAWPWLSSNTC